MTVTKPEIHLAEPNKILSDYIASMEVARETIPPDEFLQGYSMALGRPVIESTVQLAKDAASDLPVDPYTSHLEKTWLSETRHQAGRIAEAGMSDDVLKPGEMSSWLRFATGTEEDPGSLAKKLSNPKDIADKTAINVLQWHNWRLSKDQERFEAEVVPGYKEKYREMLQQGVNDSWIPGSVLSRIDRLDRAAVFLDDGSNTAIDEVAGTHGEGLGIAISPKTKEPMGVFVHEADHLLSGVDDDQPISVANRKNNSGLSRIFRSKYKHLHDKKMSGAEALDEAVTEHIAQSLVHGDVDVVNPYDRDGPGDEKGSYQKERFLLYALTRFGVKPVDIRLFVAAYFEPGEERQRLGNQSAAVRLATELQEAFPRKDIMFQLANFRNGESVGPTLRLVKSLGREGRRGPVKRGGYRHRLKIKDAY